MTPKDNKIACNTVTRAIDMSVSNGFHSHGPDWVKTWYDLSMRWSEVDFGYVTFPEPAATRLVHKAKRNREIFYLAMFVAGTRLASDVDIPSELREFSSDFLKGNFSPPKAPVGRSRKESWGRDFIVVDVMSDLKLHLNIPMTQNRVRGDKKKHETTASEIVEYAVRSSNLRNLTRLQIERIWGDKKKRREHRETIQRRNGSLLDDCWDIVRV